MKTKIEWTDCTWNFITGCKQVSPACDNCYAKAMTKRLQGMALKNIKGSEKYILGWDKVIFHKDALKEILDKKKYPSGSKVFVNSMSDTFHEDIEFELLTKAFLRFIQRDDLTFQILTKRPKRMYEFFEKTNWSLSKDFRKLVWFGVTAENQAMADERIPELLKLREFFGRDTILFVSIEPMLEAIDLRKYIAGLDWVIVGGENAPKSKTRPMKMEWVEDLYKQCEMRGIAFFFKQWGNYYEHNSSSIEDIKQFPIPRTLIKDVRKKVAKMYKEEFGKNRDKELQSLREILLRGAL